MEEFIIRPYRCAKFFMDLPTEKIKVYLFSARAKAKEKETIPFFFTGSSDSNGRAESKANKVKQNITHPTAERLTTRAVVPCRPCCFVLGAHTGNDSLRYY